MISITFSARTSPFAIRLSPVISAGLSRPSSESTVGATSASRPSRSEAGRAWGSISKKGTRLVVCATWGLPASVYSVSMLPWSAVTSTT